MLSCFAKVLGRAWVMNAEHRVAATGYSRQLERVGPVSVRTKLFYAAGAGRGAYVN